MSHPSSEDKIIDAIEAELEEIRREPGKMHRWSFLVAVLIIGILLSVISANLTIGPRWSILVVVSLLLIPLLAAILLDRHRWTRRLAFTIVFVLTIGLITSVIFLVDALFVTHTENAYSLFRDALLLWSANVVLFAIWYWEVDQGGPRRRHSAQSAASDFLFPQMSSSMDLWNDWKPSFTDYVFLAFNTSTAFSPTDTLAMSKRAKLLMMTQASISLVILAVLAARAINIA